MILGNRATIQFRAITTNRVFHGIKHSIIVIRHGCSESTLDKTNELKFYIIIFFI